MQHASRTFNFQWGFLNTISVDLFSCINRYGNMSLNLEIILEINRKWFHFFQNLFVRSYDKYMLKYLMDRINN